MLATPHIKPIQQRAELTSAQAPGRIMPQTPVTYHFAHALRLLQFNLHATAVRQHHANRYRCASTGFLERRTGGAHRGLVASLVHPPVFARDLPHPAPAASDLVLQQIAPVIRRLRLYG